MHQGLHTSERKRRARISRDASFPSCPILDPAINLAFAAYHHGPVLLDRGERLEGRQLHDLHLIHSGAVKNSATDHMGREHVYGFYLAGEITGIDAIHVWTGSGGLVALMPTKVYSIPYSFLSGVFDSIPDLGPALLRTMSQYSYRAQLLAGDYRAEELLAGFLMMLSRRQSRAGSQARNVTLSMSRRDIASYLRLAPETVSRLFSRLAGDGLIRVHGRIIELLDSMRLSSVAGSLLDL